MINLIIDSHVHTEFSPDANSNMEEIIKKSIEMGLKQVVFTDHVDLDSPDKLFSQEINYVNYMKRIKELKFKYTNIEILMGVEIGYQPHLNKRLNNFLKSYPFDFVICSIHSCDGLDFYNGDFFKGRSERESYMRYFETIKSSIENYANYDVYGHLDAIVRYSSFSGKKLNYTEFKEILDNILELIIKNGKGIELNTSGLRYGLKSMHPNEEILKRYFELGGEILTLGSDAHNTKDLHADFKKAIKLLKKIGFKKITKFEKRAPIFIEI